MKMLLWLLKKGFEIPAHFFEAVANTSEKRIASEVGDAGKKIIMSWWGDEVNRRYKKIRG